MTRSMVFLNLVCVHPATARITMLHDEPIKESVCQSQRMPIIRRYVEVSSRQELSEKREFQESFTINKKSVID